MNRELVQWQVEDPETNCVFPWLTHPFLEVLKTWDLSNKVVLEYGGGRSTAWWATKAKSVVSVDTNIDWMGAIAEEIAEKGLTHKCYLSYKPINEGTPHQAEIDWYVKANTHVDNNQFDIVVVDGILRHECMIKGLEILHKTGGILIADNWQQDGFVCPASEELMKPYDAHLFVQEDHTDNHGRKWCTAYWDIPKE